MKFKLIEELNNNIWYHASPEDFDEFKSNWQGIHFADSEEGAISVMENRGKNQYYLYNVKIDYNNPLYIDCDPMSWGGTTIAHLLYCKLNNINFEGAAGENYYDAEQEITTNYRNDLSPDLIHFDISKLSSGDITTIEFVQQYYGKNVPEKQEEKYFNLMLNIIKKCGYDTIIYPLAENINSKALILFDASKCKIINKKFIN